MYISVDCKKLSMSPECQEIILKLSFQFHPAPVPPQSSYHQDFPLSLILFKPGLSSGKKALGPDIP